MIPFCANGISLELVRVTDGVRPGVRVTIHSKVKEDNRHYSFEEICGLGSENSVLL